jgi:hypothetical protein
MTKRHDDATIVDDGAEAATAASPLSTERLASADLTADDGEKALAWSQEDPPDVDGLLPYDGEDPYGYGPGDWEAADGAQRRADSRWWQRLPVVAFGIAGAAALAAVGGAAIALTSTSHTGTSAPATHSPSRAPSVHSPQPPTGSVAPPARVTPGTPAPAPSRTVVTVTRAPTRQTVPPPASATTPAAPPSETPPPQVAPPTPESPTAPPMTTAYLRVPFVPVPIPIQVPSNPNQPPPYQQQPQYPYQYPYQPSPYGQWRP